MVGDFNAKIANFHVGNRTNLTGCIFFDNEASSGTVFLSEICDMEGQKDSFAHPGSAGEDGGPFL